jgi:3-dehydroquinate synthase
MKKIQVQIQGLNLSYPIIIGTGILRQIESLISVKAYSHIFIITDTVVEKILLKNKPELFSCPTECIVIPSGERAKTVETVAEIWKELILMHCDRSSLIVNIGGGVVCDIGGFAASTFMRGVDFINVPTTLLSQVDASVGGKTAINFENIKNIIGSFQQPKAVIIDIDTLPSLPRRTFTEGFAEIIKHALIAEKKYFDFVSSKKPEDFSKEELIEIITTSCKIKKDIIEHDINEKGKRRLVNFGHTLGHAIEAASLETDNPLLHGEAVSIGIVAECFISLEKKLLSETNFKTIVEKLTGVGLPTQVTGIKKETVIEKLAHDKKQEKGSIQWTLLKNIGEGIINQTVSQKLIEQAVEKVIGV